TLQASTAALSGGLSYSTPRWVGWNLESRSVGVYWADTQAGAIPSTAAAAKVFRSAPIALSSVKRTGRSSIPSGSVKSDDLHRFARTFKAVLVGRAARPRLSSLPLLSGRTRADPSCFRNIPALVVGPAIQCNPRAAATCPLETPRVTPTPR